MANDEIPSTPLPESHRDVLLAVSKYLDSPDSDGIMRDSQIEELRAHYPKLGTLRAILPALVSNGCLTSFGPPSLRYKLTIDGLRVCGLLRSSRGADPEQRSETEWTPLTLERDSDTARSAIHDTTELLERVRGENGFASTEPEKHAATVWSLQAGLDAIEKRSPSLGQVKTLLLTPMRWLSDKFACAAIGELAKAAIQSLLHWLF